MARSVDISQWRDRTEEPVIVWAYVGVWELQPVAVDDSHECDMHDEYTRAWFAAGAYQTRDQVEEEFKSEYTPEQIEELYSRGDYSAEAAGLPTETYAEGCEEDGSDTIIYIDEVTWSESRRESLEEAAPYLDPEDVAEIRAEIDKARAEYAR